MRLTTITNLAYGATVALTLAGAATMLCAGDAQQRERAAVTQRHRLDEAATRLGDEVYAAGALARSYAIAGRPADHARFARENRAAHDAEARLRSLRDAGATPEELAVLARALAGMDALAEVQARAVEARRRGDRAGALAALFGPAYTQALERGEAQLAQFRDRLDRRTDREVAASERIARLWRTVSELVLALTGLLFLGVLYFVFKRRVLRPVVRLSDVVSRLAAQDYAAELPPYAQVDEIGDMTQALRVFRENGLERQRLEREREAELSLRDLLSRMTQRMQGCDTLDDLKAVVRRFVPEIVPGAAGRLYLLDREGQAMVAGCEWNEPCHGPDSFPPHACWAVRRGAAHRPAGHAIDVPCGHLEGAHIAALDPVCLPLNAPSGLLGLLYLEGAGAGITAGDADLTLLAENVGLAVANLSLREALRAAATIDPLTGLANRRLLDSLVPQRLERSRASGTPVACLMIDIDHFKRINDTHGHDAGDAVLQAVGATLRAGMRDGDLVFRFGGEEFMVLLTGAGVDAAALRAEELRVRVAAAAIAHDGREIGPVTVSIGVASAPLHGPVDRLVRIADAALLRAKAQGRNRIAIAPPPPPRRAAA